MTREEAISRLRGLVLYDEDEEALAVLAPELSESHDETMRKMAINAVCSPDAQECLKSWGTDPNDVIAWLEKQKKPTQVEKNYIREALSNPDVESRAYKDAKAANYAIIVEDGWIVRVYADDTRERIKYLGETEVEIKIEKVKL